MKNNIIFRPVACLLIASILSFFTMNLAGAQQMAVGNQLVDMTSEQFSQLTQQRGLSFSRTPPPGVNPAQSIVTLPDGRIAIKVYSQTGGGFVVGTPANIAAGLNTVGATIGASAASFAVGAGLTAGMLTAVVAGAVVVVGGIAAAAGGLAQNQNAREKEESNRTMMLMQMNQNTTTRH